MKRKVIGNLDYVYVQGHLRYGHLEVEIDEDELRTMSEDDIRTLLEDEGTLVVEDYEVDDRGDIVDIEIE